MPIYEYRCTECHHEMEAVQRISADPLLTCPQCGQDALKRLISQTSFVLKGGGWYATDYAGKKTHTSGDSGGASASTETKPSANASDGASKTSSDT